MSDAVEKTAAGATKGFFGALGFILLMLGLEGMTGAAGIQFGLGLFLVLLGAFCFYAAFFWETAKRVLSAEAQDAIGRFAQSRITWFGMIFLVLQTLILSRFIEGHHWPFSYPADPAIYLENAQLKAAAQATQNDAAKWRFALGLRYGTKAANGGLLDCKFALVLSREQSAWNIWTILQPMLELAHWQNFPINSSPPEFPFDGITVISGDNKDASNCGASLGKALGQAFPAYHISVLSGQTTPILNQCKNECVELDIGN